MSSRGFSNFFNPVAPYQALYDQVDREICKGDPFEPMCIDYCQKHPQDPIRNFVCERNPTAPFCKSQGGTTGKK